MAQGPEGIAMASYSAVLGSEDGIVLNAYEALDCTFTTPGGERAKLSLRGGYPWKGEVSVSLELPSPEIFTIRFRIPFWWKGASSFRLNGETLGVVPGEYLELKRQWRNTDRIMITFDLTAEMVSSPDLSHTGYLAGPIVLAQDSRLGAVARPIPGDGIAEDAEVPSEEFHIVKRLSMTFRFSHSASVLFANSLKLDSAPLLTICGYSSHALRTFAKSVFVIT